MNIAFDRFRHPQKQGFQGGDLSDDHWSPDEAARWALRRAREERARKRVRWIAAAIVFTAFILAATVLLAQDNAELTRQAAEQGAAEAQYNLGSMYADGRGVPKDEAEAARWYRLAADQGDASAQFMLAGAGRPQGLRARAHAVQHRLEQMGTQAPESIGTFLSVT